MGMPKKSSQRSRRRQNTTSEVRVERAARSMAELGFLESIVDHPTDDAARLVYADWLEESGDLERAVLLRGCIAARTSGKWPSLESVPPVWADITAIKSMRDFIQADLGEHLHLGRPTI